MVCRALILAISALIVAACSTGVTTVNADLRAKTSSPLTIQIAEFGSNQAIPNQNTAEGGNKPPTISWTATPPETKTIALIADDPDANGFTHWVVYDIPPEASKLPASAAIEGKNGSGSTGYFGPKPPPGKPHHYHFHLYALDTRLPLQAGASKEDVLKAMSGHVLADGELVGIYQSG
jgi:Raf kinase inhibitor-like YbhB/YbcL family protein